MDKIRGKILLSLSEYEMRLKCKKMKGEKEQEGKLLSDEKGSRGTSEEKSFWQS